ncbi:hypothetical protein HMPREF1985_01649 [Mitsuokella sp. oral taxon 131 str. W9106]|nr:hypothetical protein HMPREF1985_01649 [Mitsuokella sp. oral taxon 131 str. W9106]
MLPEQKESLLQDLILQQEGFFLFARSFGDSNRGQDADSIS